ncbi:MAG TPA: ATP-binding protein, partial [Deferrisomatales bacterium]|nr:ATP-binding protein [Deferrisomatales bacterium]
LSFWLATLCIGGVLVVLALTSDPRQVHLDRHGRSLGALGRELVEAHRGGGVEALQALQERLAKEGRQPAFLFQDGRGPLSGRRVPRMAQRLVAQAAATGEVEVRPGRQGHGLWLALPLEGEYVLLAEVPPPSRLERLLNPYGLGLRLAAAFVVIGVASYLLARYLSAPIRALRLATRRLAAGDLSARVGPALGGRRDESAELGREFDRMAEQVEAGVEARKRLLRDVSHELRSPLARLGVALELARQSAGERAGRDLDRIGREAERLNELIGQLLGLAALEGDAGAAARVAVDLDRLLRAVVRDAEFEAGARGVAVQLEGESGVTLQGVPELLRRALENVVRNAVRFTAVGSAVEVTLVALADRGAVRISVRDRGPGVPEAALTELFQPFYRVAEARDRESGGAGIGLAIVEQAVRLHGGSVRAENAAGGGLRVTVELPTAAAGRPDPPRTVVARRR